jgi:hypothetical protein
LSLFFVTDAGVCTAVRRLKLSNSVGLDGIPALLLRAAVTFLYRY